MRVIQEERRKQIELEQAQLIEEQRLHKIEMERQKEFEEQNKQQMEELRRLDIEEQRLVVLEQERMRMAEEWKLKLIREAERMELEQKRLDEESQLEYEELVRRTMTQSQEEVHTEESETQQVHIEQSGTVDQHRHEQELTDEDEMYRHQLELYHRMQWGLEHGETDNSGLNQETMEESTMLHIMEHENPIVYQEENTDQQESAGTASTRQLAYQSSHHQVHSFLSLLN